MDNPWVLGTVLTAGFLIVFGLLWLLITKLLMSWSGWAGLEQRFPDQPRAIVLEKWSMASGAMGKSLVGGVNFRNCLVIHACVSGLRFKPWRVMAPFSQAFFVPWSQIATEDGVLGTTLLHFGMPQQGTMRISSRFGRKIKEASRGQFVMPGD